MTEITSQIPSLPIPISAISNKYLIFSIEAASYLRRVHKICGYNIGTLPQNPSQNVFLGLPVMIMAEEAQLLVDEGVCYIVDDARAHDELIQQQRRRRRKEVEEDAGVVEYMTTIQEQQDEIQQMQVKEREEARRKALSKQTGVRKTKKANSTSVTETTDASLLTFDDNNDDAMEAVQPSLPLTTTSSLNPQSFRITPTISHPLITTTPPSLPSPPTPKPQLPNLPPSYPLFRHLHTRGYYMTPGLRFGCQYSTYPGDPLRFHSHFLAVGVGWEEEIDLMALVGGGRLGTGVKKAFLLGGEEKEEGEERGEGGKGRVRTFSVEWAVM